MKKVSKSVENFFEFIWAQTDSDSAEKQDLKGSGEWTVSQFLLCIWNCTKRKGDYMKVGEIKAGIMCFLEADYIFEGVLMLAFQRHINLDAQEQWRGLA